MANPPTAYTTNASANGTAAERSIARKLPGRSVRVRVLTSRALVDMGEQRSPKYAPASTAPPASSSFAPMERAMVMHTTPMVAEVPNDVPVRNDMRPHSRKMASGAAAGTTSGAASMTISATVPHARHEAVSTPMSTNAVSTPRAVAMPERPIRANAPGRCPRARP